MQTGTATRPDPPPGRRASERLDAAAERQDHAFDEGDLLAEGGNAYVGDLVSSTVRKIAPGGVVAPVVGVAASVGIRLGNDPRLCRPRGLVWLPTGQLAITWANAVLLYTLP